MKVEETITISVEQYSGKKLQLNLLGDFFFVFCLFGEKFNKWGVS